MTENLQQAKCVACEGGVDPLTPEQAAPYRKQIHAEWHVQNGKMISRDFAFKDFKQSMIFINKLADLAESEGHHPDISLHNWNKVRIDLWTHAIGGLSINDFIVASKTDSIYGEIKNA